MRAVCQWLGLLLLCVAMVGCGEGKKGDSENSDDPNNSGGGAGAVKLDKGTIGISVQALSNPFFKVIADTVEVEANKHGYKVLKRDAENKVANQNNQVEEFIVSRVDAIILCPRDTKAIGEVIRKANDAGIPVFTIDTICEIKEAKVVFHVGTDNLQGGEVAGQAMIDALGKGGGEVAVLELKKVDSCVDRVTGFTKVIDAYNETAENKITIVTHLECEGDKAKGQVAARDAMSAHADLRGIFAINDPAALGARAALEAEGKADQIVVIGFDGQPEGKQGVKDGKLFDTPTQFPARMSIECVKAIMKYFDGEKIEPKSLLLDTAPYRKADADKDPSLK
ncbi:MAG: substrate-binding domain-containing protein [Planctomycetes bacterium]|nr:substrate-binding domain-containing protein [Planctomycetota bacterium]